MAHAEIPPANPYHFVGNPPFTCFDDHDPGSVQRSQ